jgi:hypothetical protein
MPRDSAGGIVRVSQAKMARKCNSSGRNTTYTPPRAWGLCARRITHQVPSHLVDDFSKSRRLYSALFRDSVAPGRITGDVEIVEYRPCGTLPVRR